MNNDLISGNFADGIDKSIIRKVHKIFKIIFLLFLAYTIFDIFDWFMLLSKIETKIETPQTFFYYRVRPILSLIVVLGNLLIIQFYINANNSMSKSFEEDDNSHFNRGYVFFYRAAFVTLVVAVLSVLSMVIRLLLTI